MNSKSEPYDFELVAAEAADKPVFENLIQFYLYDMAAQSPFPVNSNGRYAYDMLDRFWEHPYLFRLNGDLAGFGLVIKDCPIRDRSPCWFLAEFCVLRPYQRLGLGTIALGAILDRHPGQWEIAWINSNMPAAEFWPSAIPALDRQEQQVHFDGMDWTSLSFQS